jgi:peptidoglycan/xylan/chitin deacetylase (PgdA/CDA1 family)
LAILNYSGSFAELIPSSETVNLTKNTSLLDVRSCCRCFLAVVSFSAPQSVAPNYLVVACCAVDRDQTFERATIPTLLVDGTAERNRIRSLFYRQKSMSMRPRAKAILATIILCGYLAPARACDNAAALGTSRVLKVKSDVTAGFGRPFPALPLAPKEIILSFDDGPVAGPTSDILDILSHECIRATFFMIGKRAQANPQLVARVRDGGHTLASHSYSHKNLDTLPADEAMADIQHGYEAVEKAAFGPGRSEERARLFRFPSYKSTPELVSFVRSHHGIVAGWDISSEDWRGQPAEVTMQRVRHLLDRRDRGNLSLHDSQKNTVALLPMIIAEMRARGLRIVHIVPE